MKVLHYLYVFFALAILSCTACSEEDITPGQPDPDVLDILTLGDSRVEGARPEFESYRYELWKNLVDADWVFDLRGALDDEAEYPTFMGMSFDDDHAGVGGFTTTDVLDNLDDFLTASGAPDVVLLGIGGNDLTGGRSPAETVANIQEIIRQLQVTNDSLTIFLEQIAPGTSDFMTPELTNRFDNFNQAVKTLENTQGAARVIVVNMAEGWSDDYMADEVHYNEAGAKVVADRYFDAMRRYLEP